jgi:two-component system CitB family response regulator/CitB family two-component system response regulator MalR
MIVEDDPMVRSINEGFIKKMDNIRLAGSYDNLEEAKDNIEKIRPDLILLDVFFPNEKGIDLLKWLRKNNILSDVIFITADNTTATIEEAKRFGAIDYLIKPFRFERLNDAIARYREMKTITEKAKKLNQDEVDQLLEIDQPMQGQSNMTNINMLNLNRTYALILEFLTNHSQKGYTAKEVGQELGLARITARRYLDQMEIEGIISVTPIYGSIGRPQNYYKIEVKK